MLQIEVEKFNQAAYSLFKLQLKKNKIEGTPILKLAMVKELQVKKFPKIPKKFTQKVH